MGTDHHLLACLQDKYRKTRSELADMTAQMEEQTLRAETAEEEAKVSGPCSLAIHHSLAHGSHCTTTHAVSCLSC